ncbi:BRCA2-interacting transcriptional repressor EMSY [Onthophagus taurus]|uniref:BRCA2-interacting transcriptional repressor EMSY n=1 Tax=Onthophagus taurus TaxID=166361 RepID=UPI0039BEB80F
MWPLLLDMTKDESVQSLRCLELEAYGCLISALRAQGPLSQDKLKLLRDAGIILNISQDRHKAEVRRAVNDEKLNTIAYHVSGQKITTEEWALEGRRLVPLMQRVVPQTAYSAIADEMADISNKHNRQLPNPSSTERKRPASSTSPMSISDINKSTPFRNTENSIKLEDGKKRKLPINLDGPSLSPHIMGPPKMSRIQQIYRQKTRARQKEQSQFKKTENELTQNKVMYQQVQQKVTQKVITPPTTTNINILQNISIPTHIDADEIDGKLENMETGLNASLNETEEIQLNSDQLPINLPPCSTKPIQPGIIKSTGALIPTTKKTLTSKCLTGQKLIVVSNPQSMATTSILQRTLTIPFVKNISVKNFDKFKIVTTNSSSTNVQLTSLSNSNIATGQSPVTKHKVVTVRTNPTVKKVIPLSQLQILNAKGGIKVLPIGGKIITKTNSGSTPVYIVNSSNMQCLTKCTSSTPVIMTCKPQGSPENKSLLVLKNPTQQVQQNLEVDDREIIVEQDIIGKEVEVKQEDGEEEEVEDEEEEEITENVKKQCNLKQDDVNKDSLNEVDVNETNLKEDVEENIESLENDLNDDNEKVIEANEKTEMVQCTNSNEFTYVNGLSPSVFPTSNV